MAATTLATSLSLIKDHVLQKLIFEFFIKPDPLAALLPMVPTDKGFEWTQEYTSEPSGAANMGLYDTMTSSAFTVGSFKDFLAVMYKMDDRNMLLGGMGEGQQGHNDRLTKKEHIIAGLAKLWRQNLQVGNPNTVAVGADVQTLLGATYAVEVSPRCHTFANSHPKTGTPVATLGGLKWTNADDGLQYRAPGATYWGPKVTMSATKRWRVPLFSGRVADGTKDDTKWCYVTATWATINAAGDFNSDTLGTDATSIKVTPSEAPTGLYYQVHPDKRYFSNLSLLVPNAAGTAVSQPILDSLAMDLLDASGNESSRCFMLMPKSVFLAAGRVVSGLAGGSSINDFMGTKMNTPGIHGISFHRSRWLPKTLGSSDASVANLTCIIGGVIGEDAVHAKYNSFSGDVAMTTLADVTVGAVAQDETPTGTPLPLTYYETKAAGNTFAVNQIGAMLAQPVSGAFDKLIIITELTQ